MHGSPTSCDGAAGVRLPPLRALSLSLFPFPFSFFLSSVEGQDPVCARAQKMPLEDIFQTPFLPWLIDDSPFHLAQPFPDLRKIGSEESFEGLHVFSRYLKSDV